MSRKEKLIKRLLDKPKDFTWEELKKLLAVFNFEEVKTGKTSGSRTCFVNSSGVMINLHKPHPHNILKSYQIQQIIEILEQEGLI